MMNAEPVNSFNKAESKRFLDMELDQLKQHKPMLDELAKERSKVLVDEHERFRKTLGIEKYEVGAIIPPDVLGVYILFPVI